MTKIKLILGVIVLLVCFCFSEFLSHYTYNSDFPVFYYAANTILDPKTPNTSVYDIDTDNQYSMPEAMGKNHVFLFSMPGAYIISPLALMSYFRAKSVMIFINILMYLAAIIIALRIGGASGRWLAYPLALLCLWPPFVQNLRHGQINALLLFLIAVAVLAATKNRPVLCGVFLAIATLFKLFPIAIAMVLGIKNWRIFVSSVVVFGVSFLIPGSLKWLHAIGNIYPGYNPIYLFFKPIHPILFYLYAAVIAGITALIVYRTKDTNYLLLTSFAIPAVFLTMPILEYYHLTLLTFSYAYLISSPRRSNPLLLTSFFLSIILISIPFFHIKSIFLKFFVPLGLFVFWGALAYNLSRGSFMRDQNV